MLELRVKVIGSKPVTVIWYRDGEEVQADDRTKMVCNGGIHVLRVDHVEINDEAVYKCVAKNAAGSDQCEAEILVEGIVVLLVTNILFLLTITFRLLTKLIVGIHRNVVIED